MWFDTVKMSNIKYDSESQEGLRDKFKTESEIHGLVYTQVEITPQEEECRQWVLANEIKDYTVEEDMHCPQQPASS